MNRLMVFLLPLVYEQGCGRLSWRKLAAAQFVNLGWLLFLTGVVFAVVRAAS